VAVQDLLGQRQPPGAQHAADFRVLVVEFLVGRGQEGAVRVRVWSRARDSAELLRVEGPLCSGIT
jgi:hypothetical protein